MAEDCVETALEKAKRRLDVIRKGVTVSESPFGWNALVSMKSPCNPKFFPTMEAALDDAADALDDLEQIERGG